MQIKTKYDFLCNICKCVCVCFKFKVLSFLEETNISIYTVQVNCKSVQPLGEYNYTACIKSFKTMTTTT